MSSCKILYVCQEITPYLAENDMSTLCRTLSQSMQERGNEIRTFMPRYGLINERRNQLHEVIRLSGMNLIIDDNDHQGRVDPFGPCPDLFYRQRGLLSA